MRTKISKSRAKKNKKRSKTTIIKKIGYGSLLSLVFLTLIFSGCLGGNQQSEPDTNISKKNVKVGILAPLDIRHGTGIKHGVELAVQEINADGGILGKKIEVEVKDTGLDPSTASTNFRKLANQENADVVMGVFSSGIALAVQPVMVETQTLWLSDSATPRVTKEVGKDYENYKYFFRVSQNNATTMGWDMAETVSHLNSNELNIEKVAVIRDSATWTDDVIGPLENGLEEQGVQIVMDKEVPKGTDDFSSMLLEAEKKADLIIPILAHSSGTPLVKQWHDMKIDALVAGTDLTAQAPDAWESSNGKCKYEIFIAHGGGIPINVTNKTQEFVKSYKEKFGHKPESDKAYGFYDGVYMYKKAVEMAHEAGEENPFKDEVVVKYLEKIDRDNPYPGIRGKNAFTENHDLVWGDEYVRNWPVQWHNRTKQVILTPQEMATGELEIPPWVSQ